MNPLDRKSFIRTLGMMGAGTILAWPQQMNKFVRPPKPTHLVIHPQSGF